MFIDKRYHYFCLRSNSAWTKKTAALRKISLARLSSRFTRSNCLSALVRSSGQNLCLGVFAALHQVLKVSGVQPILTAMEQMAAQVDVYSPCYSNTRRTARSRISALYLLVVFMTPFSQTLEPPTIRGGSVVQSTGKILLPFFLAISIAAKTG